MRLGKAGDFLSRLRFIYIWINDGTNSPLRLNHPLLYSFTHLLSPVAFVATSLPRACGEVPQNDPTALQDLLGTPLAANP